MQEAREQHLEELMEFLRIPSISALTAHKGDCTRAAGWLAARLERAGLAARRRSSDDRRKVVVEITDDGRRWLYGILPVYLQALKEEFAVLTAEERADLGKLCRILGHGLRSSGDATGRTEVGGAR